MRNHKHVLVILAFFYVVTISAGTIYLASHSRMERYLSSDLVARFTFREKKYGTVENIAGTGKAKLHNPGWTKGNGYRLALRFDGKETYIRAESIPLEDSFTITSWLKSYDLSRRGVLAQTSNGEGTVGLTVFSSFQRGKLGLSTGQNTKTVALSKRSLAEGWWQHVAVVFDHGKGIARFYVNGEYAGSGELELNTRKYGEDVLIGVGDYKTEENHKEKIFLNAALDSISFYNRVLSEEEVGMLVS